MLAVGFFLIYFIEEFVHTTCDSKLHGHNHEEPQCEELRCEEQCEEQREQSLAVHRYNYLIRINDKFPIKYGSKSIFRHCIKFLIIKKILELSRCKLEIVIMWTSMLKKNWLIGTHNEAHSKEHQIQQQCLKQKVYDFEISKRLISTWF